LIRRQVWRWRDSWSGTKNLVFRRYKRMQMASNILEFEEN